MVRQIEKPFKVVNGKIVAYNKEVDKDRVCQLLNFYNNPLNLHRLTETSYQQLNNEE